MKSFSRRAGARAVLRLTRPHNCLGGGLLALLGAHLAESSRVGSPALFAAASMAFAIASANALNDTLDVAEDRTNRPERPIASGALSRGAGFLVAGVSAAIALALAARLGGAAFAGVALVLALGAFYSLALKSTVLVGNALVGALSASPCALGGWVSGTVGSSVLVASTFAGLFVFAREVLKTAADYEGDANAGVRTAATRFGVPAAIRLSELLFGVVSIAIVAPWIAGRASNAYAAMLGVGFFVPLIAVLVTLHRHREKRVAISTALRISKVMWFTSLFPLAFLR